MRERDVVPVVLPDDQHQDILTTLILPAAFKGAVAQQRPVTVFVAGQPGAGKSHLADLLHEVLHLRGGAVRIGADLYKTSHPGYPGLLARDDRTAGARVRPDTRRWQEDLEERARHAGFDAVIETALADTSVFRALSAAYRRARHRIEVAVVATPQALSQLSVLGRYMKRIGAAGTGRYVSLDNHDACCRGLLETLTAIEAEQLADRVTVFRRGLEMLYSNELTGTGWLRPPRAVDVVADEQARPWSAMETARFRRELSEAERSTRHERMSYEQRLAVTGCLERAFAWAEPVRRMAQARPMRIGVDYHRLSREEHQAIFDEQVVPLFLSDIVARQQPVAVYVIAQPGAGKTYAADLIQHTMPHAKRLTGDDFKALHPDYLRRLQNDPRGAGAAIRADYRSWMAQAEDWVRARRGDLIIELAPGSAADFLDSAIASRRAGYRVEVVLLSVRAADSRQSTAHRYALVESEGLPGRFTSRSGHDQCFAATAEVARIAEGHRAVDSVSVMRRSGEARYRNERLPDGTWRSSSASAAMVLDEERRLAYTEQEAVRFLNLHRFLWAVLPQYRGELADMLSLARPLMPAAMQPRRLSRPSLAAPLPVPLPPPGS
ncbi:zeta toxin family protein [Streptomyces lasiicapitis]|uniref:UDP-N-acetylglucosamine kinase n=1 Tax=Streptomyces lasiicapitis TaxID=1923961 RepID=A0ABQ2MUH8_9ACTN|nr:zeta toxin family protein [Streptomyces lasiicapitis]GGO58857.1 ATP/GTP-binding protein [Streptomyces lasiicapitis]